MISMKTISRSHYSFAIITILLCCDCLPAWTQIPIEINKKAAHYIDIARADRSIVHEIQEGILSLQYNDRIGYWKDIPLKIYNGKLELVGNFTLDKSLGVNNYIIDLKKRLSTLETGKVYFCVLQNENGDKHELVFKEVPPVRSKDMDINILINPIQVSCRGTDESMVEFYGDIRNGKAPYSIRWYVMNSGKTDFLYQPKEENVTRPGKTSVLQVDKAPAYYVMIDVTDACGTNSRKMVFLDCRKGRKKINTIFVQPLPGVIPTAPQPPSN